MAVCLTRSIICIQVMKKYEIKNTFYGIKRMPLEKCITMSLCNGGGWHQQEMITRQPALHDGHCLPFHHCTAYCHLSLYSVIFYSFPLFIQ